MVPPVSAPRSQKPLEGTRVVEFSQGVAAAYCGRILAVLGAEVTLLEPPGGHRLRSEPPFLDAAATSSALFAYLAAGKVSRIYEPDDALGVVPDDLLREAHVFIHDVPAADTWQYGLDPDTMAQRFPALVNVSVLPFGASGPKADWRAEEVNLIHAAGEGYLLPNGLSVEMFPDRPPLKIYGHFAEMQGGIAAALGALSALWAGNGQSVDVSAQDAALAVGCFAIQRLGDGSVEHRAVRSFKYGGVLECRDGFVELLTLEERQWRGLVELMGRPEWATDSALEDGLERSRRGPELNERIRAWAIEHDVTELVTRAQTLGVPMARYNSPSDVLSGPHERARGLFQPVDVSSGGALPMLVAPYHFGGAPLELTQGVPQLGAGAKPQAVSGKVRAAG